MGLSIKNPETVKLVRELARGRGQGITEALTNVVREAVERDRRKPKPQDIIEMRRRVQEIVDEVKKLPVLDDRSPDEIIGYNDQGHFD